MKHPILIHLSLLTVSTLYAFTFSITKIMMPAYITPNAFILIRIATAAAMFLLFHVLFVKEKIKDKKDFIPIAICAITGSGVNMLLFFKGLAITTPINGAILMTCTPIFVVIFATLMLKESISFVKVTGIMLACTGAFLLMGGEKLNFTSATLLGDIYVTINAIIYSFYLVYAKPLLHKYHPITLSKWSFLMGTVFILPFGFNELLHTSFTNYTGEIWFFVTYVAIGSTFITYLLNSYALRRASPALVGTYIYLQPVLATLIALYHGLDHLSFLKSCFILLIFAGVFLVTYNFKLSSKISQ